MSKLADKIFDRIPYTDGALRRKISAGVIVLIGPILIFHNDFIELANRLNPSKENSIITELLTSPTFLILAVLIIVAVGNIVELIGEHSIARAASGFFYGAVYREDSRSRRKGYKQFDRFLRISKKTKRFKELPFATRLLLGSPIFLKILNNKIIFRLIISVYITGAVFALAEASDILSTLQAFLSLGSTTENTIIIGSTVLVFFIASSFADNIICTILGILGKDFLKLEINTKLTKQSITKKTQKSKENKTDKTIKDYYIGLPEVIKTSLEHPLGNTIESAWKYLTDEFECENDRIWGRRLVSRIKDTQIIISSIFIVAFVSIIYISYQYFTNFKLALFFIYVPVFIIPPLILYRFHFKALENTIINLVTSLALSKAKKSTSNTYPSM